jgi:hypothetical protein
MAANSQRFPYIRVSNSLGENTLRPQMPFTLTFGSKSRNVIGLLDTGADVNVLPYQFGVELGAVWEDQKPLTRLSGNLGGYEARGILTVATIDNFSPVELVFAWTRSENVPFLLGQMNFFLEFNVCFYRSQGFFEINLKDK